MAYVKNGVVWQSRRERRWAYFLLEYTRLRNRFDSLFERRK